jgi:hypothetical protein
MMSSNKLRKGHSDCKACRRKSKGWKTTLEAQATQKSGWKITADRKLHISVSINHGKLLKIIWWENSSLWWRILAAQTNTCLTSSKSNSQDIKMQPYHTSLTNHYCSYCCNSSIQCEYINKNQQLSTDPKKHTSNKS